MATVDFNIIEIKKEILNKLRSNLNSEDDNSRVTETVDQSYVYDASNIYLINATKLSYVSDVKVNGVSINYFTDWTMIMTGANQGSIQISSTTTTGDVIKITYGVSATRGNFIYQDFPREDLNSTSYPRIGFNISFRNQPGGAVGGNGYANLHEGLLQIKVVDEDVARIDELCLAIHQYVTRNCKNFAHFNFIQPSELAEYDTFNDNTKKTFSKFLNFTIPSKYEVVEFA